MRILALEPWLGGSHARFLGDFTRLLPFETEVLGLPARSWKWRMRTAAVRFAEQARARLREGASWDALFAFGHLDLALFRALAPPPVDRLPTVLYMHENQFAYPVRREDPRDLHFAVTNLMSALAANRVVFNSRHNRDTFFEGAEELARHVPDVELSGSIVAVRAKTTVIPVPLDLVREPACRAARPDAPPLVLWNHRWEYDKDPETFFAVVGKLAGEGVDFRLAVVGESFREHPPVFDRARETLAGKIDTWGFLDSREEYLALLRRATVVVSTARHEFQGLSVLEAVARGAHPLVPRRLAYPEFHPASALYDTPEQLEDRLRLLLATPRDPDDEMIAAVERVSWSTLRAEYEHLFDSL